MESVSIDVQRLQQQPRTLAGLPPCMSHYLYQNPLCQEQASDIERDTEQAILPLVKYALQSGDAGDAVPIHLIHIEASVALAENSAFLAQVLNALAAPVEAWAPICSSHTYLLHCLESALMQVSPSMQQRILVYVGDYNNAAAFRSLAQRHSMSFCCQAML